MTSELATWLRSYTILDVALLCFRRFRGQQIWHFYVACSKSAVSTQTPCGIVRTSSVSTRCSISLCCSPLPSAALLRHCESREDCTSETTHSLQPSKQPLIGVAMELDLTLPCREPAGRACRPCSLCMPTRQPESVDPSPCARCILPLALEGSRRCASGSWPTFLRSCPARRTRQGAASTHSWATSILTHQWSSAGVISRRLPSASAS
mmetsp:Transcript_29712/g.76823  ORF Transcript_29712/g.76823 Transcript_29712/m.76823 type:complete len:208 (+) Transcript_29712:513-1136(+)